jgi:general stress protein YciG
VGLGFRTSLQKWRREKRRQSSEHAGGAHFSRDKSYSDAIAQKGGQPEASGSHLDLANAYKDYERLTADEVSRLIQAADPKLASGIADLFKLTPAEFTEAAKRSPGKPVTDVRNTAYLRRAIENNASNPKDLFKRAGFNALDSGRDVRMLDGFGIRSNRAVFDPAKRDSRNIFAGVAGAAVIPPALLEDGESYDPNRE